MKDRRKGKTRGRLPAVNAGPARPAPWKLRLFRFLALVLVPLAALILVESALRAGGFGYPTSFLLPSVNHGEKTYVQNNKFGWRFFGPRRSRTPNPISILQQKPPGTIRIFVFGESAAFGDPQPAFGFPRVLQATLSLRHPGTKFEVVNAAMTAIDSHVIVPIARDCARAGGDIWIVYMGNNEVVGPFGAGTVFGPQAPPLPFIRASLAVKSTRIGQLFEAARERLRKNAADQTDWAGMQMFLDQQVSAGDPRMATVYKNFERNLADIIRAGHDSGAGVVVSTVAVNLKDCAPFASGPGASNADEQFRLGRSRLAQGDVAGARQCLSAARDLDTLRFRCDTHLNDITREAATGREQDRILLADAENAFAGASPDGLPGWNLFYEHVHLTFEGNCLLARTVGEQVEKLLPPSVTASTAAWPTAADCARRLGRTLRDLQPALAEILARLTEPPFTTQVNHNEQIQFLTAEAEKTAGAISVTGALEVARAAAEADADDAPLEEQLATLELTAGHETEAESPARRAVDLLPSSEEAWTELGYTFIQEKRYEDAVNAYQRACELNSQDVWPLQNLALAQAKLGRTNDSMIDYRRAVDLSPRFGLAWLGLGQLLEGNGQKDEAADCFKKGLENPIHTGPELATLARFCRGRGWLEAASTNYDQAIQLSPGDPALRFESGQTLAALERHSQSAERFTQAAQLSPSWGQAYFYAGVELGKSGRPAEAARQFEDAARLMPDMVEARLNLGIALYQQGEWSQSLDQFEEVAAHDPGNALAQHYLPILRSKLSVPEQ